MSSKSETVFTASVHKHLPAKLYRMKTHNPYIGGPADMWYSGRITDMWVEYKFEVLPKRPDTMIDPDLSALQRDWLKDRLLEGRKVFVIVGCKEGGVIFENRTWETPMKKCEFERHLMTRQELAAWIVNVTGGPP